MDFKCRYDIKGFSDDLGLSLAEVADLYSELVSEIFAEISKLKVALAGNDRLSIKQAVHNLKGLSGNYRIADLYELTAEIYDCLKTKDPDEINDSFQRLFEISETTIRAIVDFFHQNDINL